MPGVAPPTGVLRSPIQSRDPAARWWLDLLADEINPLGHRSAGPTLVVGSLLAKARRSSSTSDRADGGVATAVSYLTSEQKSVDARLIFSIICFRLDTQIIARNG